MINLTDNEKLYFIYMYFLMCFFVLCFDTYINEPQLPTLKIKEDIPKLDEMQTYLLNAKNTFLGRILEDNINEVKIDRNINIDSIFYNKKDFTEYIKEENTELEQKWKTRILMESTPRGNIIMYYNAYKQGFAYYSDQAIPHSILNAVSMKYVIRFFCLDFFIDNLVLPENYNSPLLKLIEEEDINDRAKKTNIMKKMSNDSKTDFNNEKKPFAKLKNYNIQPPKIIENTDINTKVQKSDTYINKFIYMGKTTNFSILQKIVIKPKVSKLFLENPNTMYDKVFEEEEQPQRKMDYKSFLTMFTKNKSQ
jgi:hypothetical protein